MTAFFSDPEPEPELSSEDLITKSGIIGRQILKFYRFMKQEPPTNAAGTTSRNSGSYWLRHHKLRHFLASVGLSRLADLLYTYYVGGSLTRQDQLTFARLNGMHERAYRLTGINALACGIPTALSYFLLGEGFELLSAMGSYTELPALIVGHTTFGIGIVSLAVDLFRAADAFLNKRCWAPFGILPLIINLPTYINRFKPAYFRKPLPALDVPDITTAKRVRVRIDS
ncbi:MAG: hypothetical protein WAK95_02350 [Desulfobacterales bacterium]